MRAIILAAGRGVRMQPLTNTKPKPLLEINGKPLIQYHVENLVSAGIHEIIINHAVMGDQIEAYFEDGSRHGANITYSAEGNEPLETGGGILKALPLLGELPFVAINADIWTDYLLQNLPESPAGLAHIVLVENPPHNPEGDFCLQDDFLVKNEGSHRYTFSGIGVYRPDLFTGCSPGVFPLAPLLKKAADKEQVHGEIYHGIWADIGTPERLQAVQKY